MTRVLFSISFVCMTLIAGLARAQSVAETPLKLADESTVSVPPGWNFIQYDDHLTMRAPEGDLRLHFVSARAGAKIDADLEKAWKVVDPSFKLKPLTSANPPGSDGWDKISQVVYDVPASEQRSVVGVWFGLKGRAYMVLIEGANATLGKRGAQMTQAIDSWQPKDLKKADLSQASLKAWSDADAREFRNFVKKVMRDLKVPGVAVGIVQNGKVVFKEGFGVRDLESRLPVTPHTLFMIGSTTKPLTTLLMSRLVEKGKFKWDSPIASVLKEFALADPQVASRMEMQHSVCACTGMPRQDLDFIFKYKDVGPEARIGQMKKMRPTTGFGETFQYSNYLVAAGGYAAARAFDAKADLASAYEEAMRAEVFAPIGMTDTVLRIEQAIAKESSRPHGFDHLYGVHVMPMDLELAVQSVAPAGAAWSNVDDMVRYLQLELADGKLPDDSVYLTKDNVRKRRTPQVKISGDQAYGLGIFIESKDKLEVFSHGGNTLGFSSDMFYLPSKGLGVVVLTNMGGANRFLAILKQKIFSLGLGVEKPDGMLKFALDQRKQGLGLSKKLIKTDVKSNAWLEAFAGRYESPDLGPAVLRRTGKGFEIEFAEWKSPVATRVESNGETVLVLTGAPWQGSFEFLPDKEGALMLDAGQQKYVFKRKQD